MGGGQPPLRASPRLYLPPKEGVPLGLGQGLGTEYSLRESLWGLDYWLDYSTIGKTGNIS